MMINGEVDERPDHDQLAEVTGLSVRNIRAYQSRRLLQPPEIRGRVGYYGQQHVTRIELVQRLQGEGFNLQAITVPGRARRRVRRRSRAAPSRPPSRGRRRLDPDDRRGAAPLRGEQPRVPRALQAHRHHPVADDGRLVTHPRLAEAGWALNLLGVGPETIIDLLFVTHRMIRRVGDVYVDVLHERLVSSVTDPGAQEVQAIRGVFEELTPHAVQIMTTLFEIVLRKEAAQSLERTIRQLPPAG